MANATRASCHRRTSSLTRHRKSDQIIIATGSTSSTKHGRPASATCRMSLWDASNEDAAAVQLLCSSHEARIHASLPSPSYLQKCTGSFLEVGVTSRNAGRDDSCVRMSVCVTAVHPPLLPPRRYLHNMSLVKIAASAAVTAMCPVHCVLLPFWDAVLVRC